ncbi:NAD(P)-dependent oxidoreductase [Flavobacterium sp. B183]|uniref:NAD-dependent epimerase/dehydratase family protein n=1 Tax=Flavobacterium sp. B183 TaxID=907046 RepID=UPI00201F500C|nr:NAD(P)-dependent oxidoreductase [Flavobacterium sp. B183]URC13099.1 NAD(P)-dependent oxidoreductase [Flavobacterium sp. B183]
MINTLLTGANGFLGSNIREELSNVFNIKTLSRKNADYSVCLEKDKLELKEKFDLVIHAAGKAHSVPKTESEIKEFYNVNVLGTLNLLKALEKCLPKEFVFVSSVAVYGQEKGNNINESYSLEAVDPYGLSKIEAERVIINWCHKNDVTCTVLRLPLLVGKNPPGNLGAMGKAINKGYYFNIDSGKAKKSMVLAKDVASFITIAAPVGGIYNLTDGKHPSFFELSYAISKKKFFSLPLSLAKLLGKIGDVLGDKAPITSLKVKKITSDLTFDDSKARLFLDWKSEPVLDYIKRKKIF